MNKIAEFKSTYYEDFDNDSNSLVGGSTTFEQSFFGIAKKSAKLTVPTDCACKPGDGDKGRPECKPTTAFGADGSVTKVPKIDDWMNVKPTSAKAKAKATPSH